MDGTEDEEEDNDADMEGLGDRTSEDSGYDIMFEDEEDIENDEDDENIRPGSPFI